jgi:signal transduction histidine kinase
VTDKADQPNQKSKRWPLDMFEPADETGNNANNNTVERLSAELKEITALYNVGVVLNSSLNSKEVLWAVYKECSRLVDTSNFGVAIRDNKNGQLKFVLVYSGGQSLQPFSTPLSNKSGLAAAVLFKDQPLLVNEVAENGKPFEASLTYPQVKARSWLGVPIVNPVLAGETAQGVICIWSEQSNAFGNHDLWLMSAIGTQASIAIRNARLYESSQRRAAGMAHMKDVAQRHAEDMRFLNEVGRTLSSTLHLDKVLTSVMYQVDEVLEVEAGSLLLTDPDSGDLVFQIALGDKATEVKPFRVPRGQGIAGQVAKTGKPLVIQDVEQDSRHFKDLDQKIQFQTRNILCVPLVLQEQIIGVIQVLNKKTGNFSQHDVDLLGSIASYAAIAIENARLYESLQAEHERSIQAEQEARKRLASDLHDGPTQLVAAIMMNLDFAKKALEKDPSLLPPTITEMQDLAMRASHQMRTLLFELRPLVLETQGLGAALQVFLDRRQKDAGPNTTLKLDIDTEDGSGDISRQDGKIEAAIFSIVQETVNNAVKHADASNIVVRLTETKKTISVSITDDGDGFDVDEVMASYETRGSLGMINLSERAEAIGGEFAINSSAGNGTQISLHIPKDLDEKEKRIKQTVTGILKGNTDIRRYR